MPPELLESQLATLEPLGVDERGMTLDAGGTPEEVTASIVERLASV
jgi:gluconate kinase